MINSSTDYRYLTEVFSFSSEKVNKIGMDEDDFNCFFNPQGEYFLLFGQGNGNNRVNDAVTCILVNYNRLDSFNNKCQNYVVQLLIPFGKPLRMKELETIGLILRKING